MSIDLFVFPMSFAQQRLWFLEQINQGSASYTISGAVRLIGPLDCRALQQALDALVERHESLRTTFAFVDEAPAQIIAERLSIPLRVIPVEAVGDWPGVVRQLAAAEVRQPFNLTRGPLLRVSLMRRTDADHVLLATMHHMVSDGWSIRVLLQELSTLYSAARAGRPALLPDLAIQYADFAHWQRELFQGEALEQQLAYWRRRLANPSVLRLPTDYPRPPTQTSNGDVESFVLSAALTANLKALSRREDITLATLLLAAFQLLLHHYSGQDDILVGVPFANRNRTDIEGIIGLFVNTLVIRADLSGNLTFHALLRQVHQAMLEAYAHQDLPFEKLVDELHPERDLSRPPLFQVAFTFQDAPEQTLAIPGVEVEPLDIHTGTAKFELTLDIEATATELRCVIEYNTDLFAPAMIGRIAAHFRHLLAGIGADPGQPIGNIPLLSADEQRQLLGDQGKRHSREATDSGLHVLFTRQARERPDAVAVMDRERWITYAELDRRANQLARYLRQLGVGPETRVGLCVERSLDLLLGILGILKADGAYVPLDPSYPRERLDFMLEDAQATVLLTTTGDWGSGTGDWGLGTEPDSQSPIPNPQSPIAVDLHADWPEIALYPPTPPPDHTDAANSAYIIYTSGSTGRPKGVVVTHANVLRLFQETNHWFQFDHTDVWTLFHSYAFDFSVWEIWGALLYGGCLVVVSYQVSRSPDACYALVCDEHVTVLNQTPSAFRQLIRLEAQALVEPRPMALRYVIFGGEALDPGSLAPWFARHGELQPRLINMYGITETTVHVTYRPITSADVAAAHTSPIGCPISDLQIYLLDRYFNLTPLGVAGEIYVVGAGLARGYLNRPELTAERFVPNPFAQVTGDGCWVMEDSTPNTHHPTPITRLYKTGDRARYLPNGDLEYLGRIDAQVKIRGFRIELGEIDAVLLQHPGMRACLTVVREDVPGDKKLVAYLLEQSGAPRQEELRQFLQARLPEYMIPSAFVYLDAFPLTENGKIDRAALPAPARSHAATEATYVAPQTGMEELLAAVWAKALNLTQVGIHDNFFVIGGDSILSLHVLATARQRGVHFSLQQLFQNPTIAELARAIAVGAAADEEEVRTAPFSLITAEDRRRLPVGIEDAYPLAMLQAGMLYHMALAPGSNIYHNTDSYHLRTGTPFNLALFQEAVAAVVARHPILRTGFDLTGYSEPLQLVHSHATLPVELYDIRHLPAAEQDRVIEDLIAREKQHHFDIALPTLLRFFIHLRTDDTFQFTLTECHAIIDGWSLNSTLVEMFQRYFALLNGEVLPEPAPLSASYRDFVALERLALSSPACEQFWTRKLDGATFLPVPRWQVAPAADGAAPQIRMLSLPFAPSLYEGLQQIVKTTAIPLKSILLAAHIKVMSLLGGQNDVLTGVTMNGRPETLDGAQLRGLFLNTVPFRLKLAPGSWQDLIQATFAAEQELLPFRRYPVAAIQQRWGRLPVYEVMFNYLHFHVLYGLAQAVPDLEEIGSIRSEGTNATLAVHFQVQTLTSGLSLDLDYDSSQLCPEQIARIGGYYIDILSAMVADVRRPHHHHSPLSVAERQEIMAWNATTVTYPPHTYLHRLFAAQVDRTPDAVAVVFEQSQLTYQALLTRADRLAATLRACGVGPEVLVGVCLERSLDLVVALYSVLLAGGAYVPLDPSYPADRLAFMLADAQVPVLLTQPALQHRLPQLDAPGGLARTPIMLNLSHATVVAPDPAVPPPPARPVHGAHPAYMIYTSGSTGRPKGALNTHEGICNRLLWMQAAYQLTNADVVLQKTPFSFDVSVWEFFWSLLVGARLVVARPGGHQDSAYLARLIAEQGVTTLHFVPSMLQVFVEEPGLAQCTQLRRVICSGEALPFELQERFFTRCEAELHNLYGPTEAAVDVTFWACERDTTERVVPIGRPIANTQVYLLDRQMQPVPVGVAGELYLGGVGLARGYWRRPDLTAERFIPNPFGGVLGVGCWVLEEAAPNTQHPTPNTRLYRTGDLARYRPDGAVEYLGRLDHQVKLHGLRIELGEIEAVLNEHRAVQQSVVLAREDRPGDRRLVAYIVPTNDERRTTNDEWTSTRDSSSVLSPQSSVLSELRAFLQERLPEYMLPSAFVFLEALPLTPNGKIDRGALLAPPSADAALELDGVMPRNELERAIADVWKNLLQIDRVGIHSNFFDLGGHSLLIIRMHSMLRQQLGRDLSITDVMQYPTIQALASYLSQGADRPSERSQRRIDSRREARREVAQRGQSRGKRQAATQLAGEGDERDS